MAVAAQDTKRCLLDMPPEVNDRILRYLPSLDLFSAMMTCHQQKSVGERLLYKSVTVYSPDQIQLFGEVIVSDLEKASSVPSFSLEMTKDDEDHYQRAWEYVTFRSKEDVEVLRYVTFILLGLFKTE